MDESKLGLAEDVLFETSDIFKIIMFKRSLLSFSRTTIEFH